MNNILLLASQSESRRRLLKDAAIPYVLIDQAADEAQCDWDKPLKEVVESIAKFKMQHVLMPQGHEGRELYVLTADTLTQAHTDELLGKPLVAEEARRMLNLTRHGVRVGTAFCLEKKVYQFDIWQTKERIVEYVESECIFSVPTARLDEYLENSIALKASGAITIEGYGAQFFKSLKGSYTTIQGLPLFELRQALQRMNFF